MSDERIVRKIQALFSKTTEQGASEAEAQTAIDMATRLMEEHHLTADDLGHEPADDYKRVDSAKFDTRRSFVGGKLFSWEAYLATFVMKFVGVGNYIDNSISMIRKNGFVQFTDDGEPRYGKSLVFFGVAEDAAIAAELYDELRILIASMAVARWGTVYKGDGAAYAEGFVLGLITKHVTATAEAKRLATDSTSLVLIARRDDLVKYKQTKATTWLESEKGIKLGSSQSRQGSQGSTVARNQGFKDGKATDVSCVRSKKLC
jgi:hypothetical protein